MGIGKMDSKGRECPANPGCEAIGRTLLPLKRRCGPDHRGIRYSACFSPDEMASRTWSPSVPADGFAVWPTEARPVHRALPPPAPWSGQFVGGPPVAGPSIPGTRPPRLSRTSAARSAGSFVERRPVLSGVAGRFHPAHQVRQGRCQLKVPVLDRAGFPGAARPTAPEAAARGGRRYRRLVRGRPNRPGPTSTGARPAQLESRKVRARPPGRPMTN